MFGTKKKLMAAVVMLVISAIMMTSASYAWFTISTNPEISDMTAKVVTNENLEIALAITETDPLANWLPTNATFDAAIDATDENNRQYTWGNIVDLSAVTAYADASLNKTLRPITLTPGTPGDPEADPVVPATLAKLQFPSYGTDGRLTVLADIQESTMANGFGNLSNTVAAGVVTGDYYGYYVDFWVRSNMGGTLILQTTGVDRSSEDVPLTDVDLGSSVWVTGSDAATQAQVNVLAKGLKIAFKEIASATSAGVVTETDNTEPVPSTTALAAALIDLDGDAALDDAYAVTFTNNNIATMTANSAKLIRMYVYYEGAALTNADALLGNALVNANLNIQFALDGTDDADVDTSMDNY